MADGEFLTPAELVARWRGRVTEETLARWRTGRIKTGPAYVRLYEGGPVLYPLNEVLTYERRHTYLRNADARI